MLKQQELDILQDAIVRLGPSSYLGPWLDSIADQLASCLRSDLYPSISLPEAAANIEQLTANAKERASHIREAADKYAEQVTAAANERAEQVHLKIARLAGDYREQLYQARHALDSLLDR